MLRTVPLDPPYRFFLARIWKSAHTVSLPSFLEQCAAGLFSKMPPACMRGEIAPPMETFTALLTAVLYCLFVNHCIGEWRKKAGRTGRPAATKVRSHLFARRVDRQAGACHLAAPVFMAIMWGIAGGMADTLFLVMMWFNATMFFAFWSPTLPPTVEFRGRGIVRFRLGFPAFCPWASIQYCAWTKTPGKLLLQARFFRYPIPRGLIPGGDEAEVTAILSRYATVCDARGNVLNPEFEAAGRPAGPDAAALKYPRFQFDLWTLLFFMLVASSAMSCYGIRYRRDREERAVLAQLERFTPKANRDVFSLSLDFSASLIKPGDRDLELLSIFSAVGLAGPFRRR